MPLTLPPQANSVSQKVRVYIAIFFFITKLWWQAYFLLLCIKEIFLGRLGCRGNELQHYQSGFPPNSSHTDKLSPPPQQLTEVEATCL